MNIEKYNKYISSNITKVNYVYMENWTGYEGIKLLKFFLH